MINNTNILSQNHLWGKAENWYVDRLTIIEPQTVCGLEEIELKIMKIQQKSNSM